MVLRFAERQKKLTQLKKVNLSGTYGSDQWVADFDVSSSTGRTDLRAPVFYIDAARETGEILRQFSLDSQAQDLLEGLDPAPFDPALLELLGYVLRRSYSEFLVYEVTAFSEEDDPLPYFATESMGIRYSLPQMGRGELSAAYLLWRVHSLPRGSIVVLEEPESHLAAFSQEKLVDCVVSLAVDRDLCLLVSSHSPGFFQGLPQDNVTYITSIPAPAVRSGLPISQLSAQLGLRPNKAAVLLVEDRVAAEVLHATLSHLDHDLLSRVDIRHVANGESGITRVLAEIQVGGSTGVEILGIFDGDQRPDGSPEQGAKINYLAGEEAPETLLRGLLIRWRMGEFRNWLPPLPEGAEALRMALEGLDGSDLHDWIEELGKTFGGLRPIVRASVDLLLDDTKLNEQSVQLVGWIRAKINAQ
ncbi:AAA family ATPase [Actinoplanes sp. NPDC026670]|uniref:AAA family ATPase n=1 Tax=Actinoplanes sp. NPDC026670 TaxID=3154700 RepID=UPI0033EEC7AD